MPRRSAQPARRALALGMLSTLGLLVLAPASPTSADTYADGVALTLVKVEPAVQPAAGAVTLTVTNVADSGGHTQNFQVFTANGIQQQQTVTVADGATSAPVTFSSGPGTVTICAQGDAPVPVSTSQATTPHGCLDVTVPDGTAEAYDGDVRFDHTCEGLLYTVTNTSGRPADFAVETKSEGFLSSMERWTLKAGETRSGTLERRWGATVALSVGLAGGGWEEPLAAATWQVPAACPMLGGTRFVKWGKVHTRATVVVRTKAFCPDIGFQHQGRKRINWGAAPRVDSDQEVHTTNRRCVLPGRYLYRNMYAFLEPGERLVARVWVRYLDDSPGTNARGVTRLTGWHTFRRP